MLNGVGARYPDRYRVISKQRAENSNQDLRPTLRLTVLNNKMFVSHLESYTESSCVSIKARKNILKMPLREERVVLHNKVYSGKKSMKGREGQSLQA